MNATNLSLKIEGTIVLKPLLEKEADQLFALVDTNREYLREFMGWVDFTKTSADSLAFIKQEASALSRLQTITLGMYFLEKLVGVLSLYHIDLLNQYASLGYWIAKDFQGKGIMTKSVQALIKYAFTQLQLHRIEIRCALTNYRSQKIAERLGFSREGILKESIAQYGVYFDAYIYGLIRAK